MEENMKAPQKIKNKITMWSINYTSEHSSKRSESSNMNIYVYSHVHSKIIHSSSKQETT